MSTSTIAPLEIVTASKTQVTPPTTPADILTAAGIVPSGEPQWKAPRAEFTYQSTGGFTWRRGRPTGLQLTLGWGGDATRRRVNFKETSRVTDGIAKTTWTIDLVAVKTKWDELAVIGARQEEGRKSALVHRIEKDARADLVRATLKDLNAKTGLTFEVNEWATTDPKSTRLYRVSLALTGDEALALGGLLQTLRETKEG